MIGNEWLRDSLEGIRGTDYMDLINASTCLISLDTVLIHWPVRKDGSWHREWLSQ